MNSIDEEYNISHNIVLNVIKTFAIKNITNSCPTK